MSSLTQSCVVSTKRFEVSSIFLTVDSNDWKGCIHAKLKAPETGISTNIAMLRPIYARPVVHAQVNFQVKSDSGKLLSCSFVGFPLAFPVSHGYRMVLDCAGGVTLDDIGKTLGIDVLNSLVTSEAHLVAEILSQVSVDRFNAAVIDNKQTDAVTTSVAATSKGTTTALNTATKVLSDTTTLESSTTALTADSATVASEAETATTVDIASAASNTLTIASETETTTTAAITTTTAAERTSTAPESTPTYHILVGSGSINNAPTQGINQDGTLVLINPTVDGLAVRSYMLDTTTGRLQDTTSGNYLCAYYLNSPSTYSPAFVANCQRGTTGPNNHYDYLKCQIVGGTIS
ncbi:uncharacterized protein FTOL_12841 [Fusarium torulosum]|uniref:Uncharacterized protein n=1 Tax=Fusarium torulosum TaxID=33205 RepID=A0AAE8SP96_9HYPO|nr:uncharacterized protein FTOL_12841 [Fusarium torulosum]